MVRNKDVIAFSETGQILHCLPEGDALPSKFGFQTFVSLGHRWHRTEQVFVHASHLTVSGSNLGVASVSVH